MSRLIRMAYGHGGTRLEHILVTAPPVPRAMSRRLKLLLLALWLVVPIMFSRYTVHTIPKQAPVIDTSQLELMPPPPPPAPQAKPAEQQPPAQPQEMQKLQEQPPAEATAPTITRPTVRAPEALEYQHQPPIVRGRTLPVTNTEPSAVPQVRRNAATTETPADRISITRSRGAATAEAPAAEERIAPLRRGRIAEEASAAAGPELRPITRKERPSGTSTGSTPQVAARGRADVAAGDEKKTGNLSPSRGVSFASLDICASHREEEEKITALLGVLDGRQSCRAGSGEYRFTGTQRISSFNLIIFPAKGRKPTNRCEELENAYRCLKAN